MRYQKALLVSFLFFLGLLLLAACDSSMGTFQQNQKSDYKLFDLLDQDRYKALHDTLHLRDPNNTQYRSDQCDKTQVRLDQCVVNDLLGEVIDHNYDANIKVMAGQYVTLDSTKVDIPNQNPMQNTVQLMRHLLYRIINQNGLDSGLFNPATKRRTTGALDYATGFFSFLDDINNKNLNLGKELVTIMRAISKFRIDKFNSSLMTKEVEFANADMDATPCQAASYDKAKCDHVLAHHKLLTYGQTSVGKSNLQADYPMWLDNGGNLITHWENINSGDSKTNVGLGNAVQGNQSLMMAVFDLVKDASFRNNLYDLIRQLGVFLSGSVPKQLNSSERIKIADVAENLIRNIESYFTTSGARATGDYATDNTDIYSSGELRNTLRELAPGNTRLMLRSDRENASLIYEVKGKKLYPFDELLKSLKLIGWDPDRSRIEESLEELVRYDQYGRDRTTDSNAHQTSHLESLLFVNSAASNFGWLDSCTVPNCSNPGEHDTNYGHGHGDLLVGSAQNPLPTKSAGPTLNDALYAMGSNLPIDGNTTNIYDLLSGVNNYEHLFRSFDPATAGQFSIDGDPALNIPSRNNYMFYFDKNYPASNFMAVASGPAASPFGGKSKYGQDSKPILNSFMPYLSSGLENDNLALSTLGGASLVVWDGNGPYYYDPEKAGKTTEMVPCSAEEPQKLCHKYYRANGKLYALVYKPQVSRSNNWEYIYPQNDDSEVLFPFAFYYGKIDSQSRNSSVFTSSVDLSGTGVSPTVAPPYKFSISMGTIAPTVEITSIPVTQSAFIDAINNALNTAAGATIDACYPFGDNYIKIKNPYGGNIVLTDITPGALNFLLLDPTLDGVTSPYTVPLNAVKLNSTATVDITIGNIKKNVPFTNQEIWDRDRIIFYLDEVFNNPYFMDTYGKDGFIIGGSPVDNPKIIKIENKTTSGPNAVEMLFNGNGNSIIREPPREQRWNSINLFDHYMGWYKDAVTNTDRYSTVTRDNNDNIKLVKLLTDATKINTPNKYLYKVKASGVSVQENIDDNDKFRACASQEEAFFKNYQWFFNEKKFLMIIPLRLVAMGGEFGIVYEYLEANGFYGFSNSRPFRGNHLWAKTGKSGSSTVPGDYRMGVLGDFSSIATVFQQTADSVYDKMLGGGAAFSSILAHNITSLVRIAFPSVTSGAFTWTDGNGIQHNDNIVDMLVPSYSFKMGDDIWNRRNAFMPILMALVNALRENSDYTRSNINGLVPSFDMMNILEKSIIYYQKDSGDYPHKTWKFHVLGDSTDQYFLKSGAEFYKDVTGKYTKPKDDWFGSWQERDYFQPARINTLLSVLIDSNRYPSNSSDRKIMDGIIPLLVAENPDTHARPKVLTQAFKLLMNLSDNKFDDPPDTNYNASSQDFDKNFQSWGARRRLFYGLEQTATLSKNTRGRYTEINDKTLTETLPDWIFTNGVDADGDGIPDDMRPEEIFANTDQNILVGSNDYTNDIKPGDLGYQMGLAYLPHDWQKNPDKLTLFRTYLEMTSELLAPQGGAYSVVENLINVMDKFFNQVSPTDDQIKGLVHTLGIMATTYDKNNSVWNVPTGSWTSDGKISFDDPKSHWDDPNWVDDMYRVAAQYQPILNAIALALDSGKNLSDLDPAFVPAKDGLTSTINYIYDSSVYFNALFKAGGLMEYVLDVVDTTDKFSEIFSELYTFLGEPLLTTFNSALWSDVAKLMSGQVQVLTRNDSPDSQSNNFQKYGFQYNGQ